MFPDEVGLSKIEVEKLQKEEGLNVLPEKSPPSQISIVFNQFKSPLVYVLLIAGLITLFIGHFTDAAIISLAVIINTVLGYVQENKASNSLRALKSYVTNKATVIRDGAQISIETSQVVRGDRVILTQGGKIPADGELIFANRLFVDEAILTGESLPVNKLKNDKVYLGTTIASGQGLMVVTTIGSNTKLGSIAKSIQKEEPDTPFQKQLKGFSKQLVIMVALISVLIFVLGVWRQYSPTEIFITSVALAVSSIPEGLLVSLTVILAIGMQKILLSQGLVRKLSAAETLGGVTVICTDKTGTLTQGKMKVVEFFGDKQDLATQVVLANDMDDPIVIAAFEWGKSIADKSFSKHTRLDSIPFSSQEKFFMSINSWSVDNNMIFVNGAPEVVLEWTTMGKTEKEKVMATIDEWSKQGKRIVGFGRKLVSRDKSSLEIEDAKSNLEWVGILAFSDPVRLGIKEALANTVFAGIKTIIITGDYPKTTQFVLRELGITIEDSQVILGDQLQNLTVDQLAQKVKTVRLFARTTPEQKYLIVEALKKNGEVVAMIGDGVNDAPALHMADIGIVVGEATDVAKESADIVLLDSNFSTVVRAVEEGRGMFDNIRKIILYLMSDAFAEIILITGSIILGLPLPITAIHILWINLVSDGFPGLALTIDPKKDNIMKDKPRLPNERLVNKGMIILIGIVSIVSSLIALTSFVVVYNTTGDLILARSMAFLTLGLDSLVYVFSVRGLMVPFWKSNPFKNKWLVVAVIAGFGLQILPFVSDPIRQLFGLSYLPLSYWLTALGLSLLMFVIIEVLKSTISHFTKVKSR